MTTALQPAPTETDTDGRVAHYCDKADIVRATVTGQPIRALCGKLWTPTHDPEGLPICRVCVAELERIKNIDRARRGLN